MKSELSRKDYNKPSEKREGNVFLITDNEIIEANSLYKRKKDKKDPLTTDQQDRLKQLEVKRKEQLNMLVPEFSFKIIAGLQGTMEERKTHFNLANEYFQKIIEMDRIPGSINKFAFEVERLQDWYNSPTQVKNNFSHIFNSRKNEFGKLIKNVESSRRSYFKRSKDWDKFFEKVESGGLISKLEAEHFKKAINNESLILMADIPDYKKEAVIYHSNLAKEWRTSLINTYNNTSIQRLTLSKRIAQRTEKIEKFKNIEKIFIH